MTNPENKGEISLLSNFAVDKVFIITNPSAYKPEALKLLIAAQMVAGKREIVVKVSDRKSYLYTEKTLHDAINLSLSELKTFLETTTNAMRDSKGVIFRETSAFSIN
jgi:hypothetical protein